MWLDDVVSHTTIRSVWANSVRDRIVQTFDTMAEANAHVAGLPDGARCYVAATGVEYVRRAGAWVPANPITLAGAIVGSGNIDAPLTLTTARLNTPAGYRSALAIYRVLCGAPGGTATVSTKLYSANGGVVQAATTDTIAVWQTITVPMLITLNPNGDTLVTTLSNNAGPSYSCFADPQNHHLMATCYP